MESQGNVGVCAAGLPVPCIIPLIELEEANRVVPKKPARCGFPVSDNEVFLDAVRSYKLTYIVGFECGGIAR